MLGGEAGATGPRIGATNLPIPTPSPPLTQRPQAPSLAFHASRIVIDAGVLMVFGAMSLPFVRSPAGDRSAIELDALPTLLLVLPIFAVTMIPDHARPLPRPIGWGALVLALAALPYSLVKYLDSAVLADTLDGSLGLGARLLVFGALVTVVGVAIGLTRTWLGLPTAGSVTRNPAVARPRRAPAAPVPAKQGSVEQPAQPRPRSPERPLADVNPFEAPLFDTLEIPDLGGPSKTAGSPAPPPDEPGRVFDIEAADPPDDRHPGHGADGSGSETPTA